jgi:hypothetical protein
MTDPMKLRSAIVMLLILTMGGLFTLYQVCFDVWMTAYPFVNTSEWRTRLYMRLATIIVIGFFWSGTVAWLFRHRRSG